ncbi:hypothetical protein B484DRAFT_19033 [Ochromonadaceae sp. CCMP2298]|nr:hypothetical protein B484DRAFT_19033 [Ochromonadaceae sp. CCMP2298]
MGAGAGAGGELSPSWAGMNLQQRRLLKNQSQRQGSGAGAGAGAGAGMGYTQSAGRTQYRETHPLEPPSPPSSASASTAQRRSNPSPNPLRYRIQDPQEQMQTQAPAQSQAQAHKSTTSHVPPARTQPTQSPHLPPTQSLDPSLPTRAFFSQAGGVLGDMAQRAAALAGTYDIPVRGGGVGGGTRQGQAQGYGDWDRELTADEAAQEVEAIRNFAFSPTPGEGDLNAFEALQRGKKMLAVVLSRLEGVEAGVLGRIEQAEGASAAYVKAEAQRRLRAVARAEGQQAAERERCEALSQRQSRTLQVGVQIT